VPWTPDWPGRDAFAGELIHAADYRSAAPFGGRDVLVAGLNTTGTEVAYYLAEGGAARVMAAVRTPPNIFPRKWAGTPLNFAGVMIDWTPAPLLPLADSFGRLSQRVMFGDLSRHGLPYPPLGIASTLRRRKMGAAVDCGFVDLVKRGRIELVAAVTGFEGEHVVLADDSRVRADAVVAATGYRRGLEPLVGHLGVLDDQGRPIAIGGDQHASAPGLFFIGYRAALGGQLRAMRFEARAIARAARRLRRGAGESREWRSPVPSSR
jgi:putative flavoprotein involved in K+ transport